MSNKKNKQFDRKRGKRLALGQKVKTIPYRNTELTSIDVTDLKTGQYFIRIATDKTVLTTRFIKE